jgi:hypothetical protein
VAEKRRSEGDAIKEDDMKKIPTMFERDPDSEKHTVIDRMRHGCEWVPAGEGVATQMWDGTCCMIRDGKLYKRLEVKTGKAYPIGFEVVDQDVETGMTIGWFPVGDGPDDELHHEALSRYENLPDGTYEMVGPAVMGNAESMLGHHLVRHLETTNFLFAPRTFDALREFLIKRNIEGIVFHHPDGRMAKIKLQDFGIKRQGA